MANVETHVERITLSQHPHDLERAITDTCDLQGADGFRLAATFLFRDTTLVLVFQK
jgi:hypothetical protein